MACLLRPMPENGFYPRFQSILMATLGNGDGVEASEEAANTEQKAVSGSSRKHKDRVLPPAPQAGPDTKQDFSGARKPTTSTFLGPLSG